MKTTPTTDNWHVYIVECADRTLYTGISTDVDRRISLHNAGRGAKYTRVRRPVSLVYREVASDRGSALRREYAIKQLSAQQKRQLIQQHA
ncbi:MAG: GIY-YIG nuclease family protein [Pseudomonadota bacterium]